MYIGGGQCDGRLVVKAEERSGPHQVHEEEKSKRAGAALHRPEIP